MWILEVELIEINSWWRWCHFRKRDATNWCNENSRLGKSNVGNLIEMFVSFINLRNITVASLLHTNLSLFLLHLFDKRKNYFAIFQFCFQIFGVSIQLFLCANWKYAYKTGGWKLTIWQIKMSAVEKVYCLIIKFTNVIHWQRSNLILCGNVCIITTTFDYYFPECTESY